MQAAALKAMANAVVITNQTGMVVWVNSAFEQLTGYTHVEIVGQSTRVLKSGRNRWFDSRYRASGSLCLWTGVPFTGGSFTKPEENMTVSGRQDEASYSRGG